MTSGTKRFNVFNQQFDGDTVAKLKDCNSSNYYYVSRGLSYLGSALTTGDTFSAKITSAEGEEYLCLTYQDNINGSSNSVINTIYGTASSCSGCTVPSLPTPTPTQTASPTPTPTVTPTLTVTPTPSNYSQSIVYVYSACTGTKRVVSQTVRVPSVIVGQSFVYSGSCWTYVGQFNSPYRQPAGYVYTTSTSNIFGTPSTIYDTCSVCITSQ